MSLPSRTNSHQKLSVSLPGFGPEQIGDPSLSEKKMELFLNEVLDSGINLIDTARSYGLSEEPIGKYITARRPQYILFTKIGYDISDIADWTAPKHFSKHFI